LHLAEDLTQITFVSLYRHRNRIERHEVLDQYARKVLLGVSATRTAALAAGVATPPDSVVRLGVWRDREPDAALVLRTALLLARQRRAVLVLVLGRPVGGAGGGGPRHRDGRPTARGWPTCGPSGDALGDLGRSGLSAVTMHTGWVMNEVRVVCAHARRAEPPP
jgi:hypothetical protein